VDGQHLNQFRISMVGTGLHLLDSLRERLPDNVDDIKDRLRDTYDTASDRVSRATNALRGEEDSQILGKVGALLIGVGIGVGIVPKKCRTRGWVRLGGKLRVTRS
jgi:hypothetical protein